MANLKNQEIRYSYERLLQVDGGQIQDGLGQTVSASIESLKVTDTLVATNANITFLQATYETSSVIYSTGSNQFGDASNDVQTFYGTVDVLTGPVNVSGSGIFHDGITGSLLGDVVGNASTATALETTRNFSASGDVTAPIVTFDGTDNVDLSITINDSAVVNDMIADDTIQNIKLVNDSIYLEGGIGLFGDGSTALGSSGSLAVGQGDGILVTADAVNLDTGSAHFISGSRNLLSVVDNAGDGSLAYDAATGIFTYAGVTSGTVRGYFSAADTNGPAGIDLSYDTSTGTFSGSLVNYNVTFGTTTVDLGDSSTIITGLTNLESTNITSSLLGNVTGNLIGNADTATSASHATLADDATTLQTSRNFSITGSGITAATTPFNGSANVVLNASIDTNAVTTSKILDGNVTNLKLANDGLTIGTTDITLGTTASTVDSLTLTNTTSSGSFSGSFQGSLTGNLIGNADTATTASYALYAISASYEINYETSSSYADTAVSASHAIQADNSTTADLATTASYALRTTSASHALYADNAGFAADTNALYTASISNATISFLKGGGGTFQITVNNVVNADSATSASHAIQSDNATTADLATTASFASTIPFSGILDKPTLVSGSSQIDLGLTTGTAATATSASYALNATTASYATYATSAGTADTATSSSYASAADNVPYSGLTGVVPTWNQDTTGTASTASYVAGSNIDGIVATATSASHAIQADTSLTSALATTSSYALVAESAITNTIIHTLTTVTASYSIVSGDGILMVSSSTAPTLTLPTPASTIGREYTVKDIAGNASTSNITVDGNGGNIDGQSTQTLNTDYTTLTVFSNGTDWYTK